MKVFLVVIAVLTVLALFGSAGCDCVKKHFDEEVLSDSGEEVKEAGEDLLSDETVFEQSEQSPEAEQIKEPFVPPEASSRTFENAHSGKITSLQFFRNTLMSASLDRTVRFWNPSGEMKKQFGPGGTWEEGLPTRCASDSDCPKSAFCFETRICLKADETKGHTAGIIQAVVTDSGLVSLGEDGMLYLWNIYNDLPVTRVQIPGKVTSLNPSYLGETFYIGTEDGVVFEFDGNGKKVREKKAHVGAVLSLRSFDVWGLYTAGHDGYLYLWHISSFELLASGFFKERIRAIAVAGQENEVIVVLNGRYIVEVLDYRELKVNQSHDISNLPVGQMISNIAVSGGGTKFIVGTGNGCYLIFEVRNIANRGYSCRSYLGSIGSVAMTPGGTGIALGGSNGAILNIQ